MLKYEFKIIIKRVRQDKLNILPKVDSTFSINNAVDKCKICISTNLHQ